MRDEANIQSPLRRAILAGGLAAGMASFATAASAQKPDTSAGPIVAVRDSQLKGKVAVVTGSARGIGRAIAVEMAANGADIVAIDICGPIASASNATPATPADLDETARQIRALGRKCASKQPAQH